MVLSTRLKNRVDKWEEDLPMMCVVACVCIALYVFVVYCINLCLCCITCVCMCLYVFVCNIVLYVFALYVFVLYCMCLYCIVLYSGPAAGRPAGRSVTVCHEYILKQATASINVAIFKRIITHYGSEARVTLRLQLWCNALFKTKFDVTQQT